VVRQGHPIAVVGIFLVGCAVLLVIGCAGVRSGAPQEKQRHTEATKKEQTRSPEATASEEEARCQGTRTFQKWGGHFSTNDLPGCPKGGLLLGTDKKDRLYGGDGDDKIRGLGVKDDIKGGPGNDILYGGAGDDLLEPWDGEDVIYGGDGNDWLGGSSDGQRNKLYCGEGKDSYSANKNDYVASSCEKKVTSDIGRVD
jgi:RTX calcium-binding nonapeptide repeat (4 copies)